jgi:hypothetical protein
MLFPLTEVNQVLAGGSHQVWVLRRSGQLVRIDTSTGDGRLAGARSRVGGLPRYAPRRAAGRA